MNRFFLRAGLSRPKLKMTIAEVPKAKKTFKGSLKLLTRFYYTVFKHPQINRSNVLNLLDNKKGQLTPIKSDLYNFLNL